eukprot:TRINITY_DN2184_c0_g1_i2.p1 TRINITY_DN2184_c0_g1~~TRINITY_DN2184_c0_g1_i2.p1  ORF type:complete len:140 (-),score=33.13 TRINITY_DN2184_c0_g1_i2:472-891(-)
MLHTDSLSTYICGIPSVDTPVVYLSEGSPYCTKVLIAFQEKGIDFVLQIVNLAFGDNRLPYFLKVNPRGKVPAVKVRDEVITESNSILLWVESKYPQNSLLPRNPSRRAQCISKLFEADCLVSTVLNFTRFLQGFLLKD